MQYEQKYVKSYQKVYITDLRGSFIALGRPSYKPLPIKFSPLSYRVMMMVVMVVVVVAVGVVGLCVMFLSAVLLFPRMSIMAAASAISRAVMFVSGMMRRLVLMLPLRIVGVVMLLVVIVSYRSTGHIMAAVWQMRLVLHAHLVAVMVGYMALGGLHHRRLNMGNELRHYLELCLYLLILNNC